MNKKIFTNYFLSIIDCLDAKFKAIQKQESSPADKGELLEIFIKNFLHDFFIDVFKIFRGGKIIDINYNKKKPSHQIDIILAAKNTIEIFKDKGIYPIESVYGVFSVTSMLNHTKFSNSINELKEIPKNDPQFVLLEDCLDIEKIKKKWSERFPYKCIFGYAGNINHKWEIELNEKVEKNPNIKNLLPDLIVVNKKGMIKKTFTGSETFQNGKLVKKHFHYTDFNINKNYSIVISHILNDLYILSTWQHKVIPAYHEYFNKELP